MTKQKKRSGAKQRSRSGKGSAKRSPRTVEEFFSKPEAYQDKWNRAMHAVSRMRADGFSLAQAVREYKLDRRTVLRLAGSALRKDKGGHYVAKASDRLLRILHVPTANGLQEIATRNSRHASSLAEYWDAVQRYLQKGDASGLRRFRRIRITDASGKRVRLLTDTEELDRLGHAGALSFESLYGRAA